MSGQDWLGVLGALSLAPIAGILLAILHPWTYTAPDEAPGTEGDQ